MEVKESSIKGFTGNGGGTSFGARFVHFCKNDLSLEDIEIGEQTLKLVEQLKGLLVANASVSGTGTTDEVERYWFACILYVAKRLNENDGPSKKGLTLCQILRAAKLNVTDFYKELGQFLIKVASTFISLYGGDWEKKVKATESQTNFVHMILLSKKYERAYEDLFLDSDSTKKTNYYHFGWLLFLALRAHVFHLCKDLVTCTHGLICVLAILLMHAPASLRNFNLKDCEHIVMKGDKADLIASLCNMYDTSEDELRKTLEKANTLLAHILKKEARLASDHLPHNLENIVTDGLVYFEDLVDENSLSSSLSLLEKDYETMIQNDWELDERIFIIEKENFLGSGSLSAEPVVMNESGTKRKLEAIYSPMKTAVKPQLSYLSPIRHSNGVPVGGQSKVLATPVSATMTTAKWLRTVVAPLPPKPSAALEGFLSSCDRDVTSDVTRRAQIILETIFPSGIPGQKPCLMDNRWAEQRRMEAMKLYYKVLLAICTAESQILHANNLTSLLTNERFHRCMLSCSAELVLATHKTVTMLFPSVLEKTGITAFDMSKVIESFIRHEESLPRELRRHLNSLEERLLESMVWEKGSSMYNSLIVARPSLSAEISRLGLLAEPMPSLDEIAMHTGTQGGALPLLQPHSKQEKNGNGQDVDIQSPKRMRIEQRSILVDRNSFTSPVKDRLLVPSNLKSKFPPHVLLSVFASPTRPNPGGAGETCAETAVNVFFGKISKLAAVRINSMVERLQLSAQIKESVYCLFQKLLSQRTSLFFNRHIDQIILCCFYGVAKISQFKLTFKEIIFDYRKQAPCKPQVFRSVYIDWTSLSGEGKSGPDRVDIITFYNEVFIPAVKPLLVELAPNGSPQSYNNGSVAGSKNHLDGGFLPASPKTSKFPPLPDMSPKKVSSVHNVYVSPLRSSKKDALISHSSKSFYACVGESTRAFQSPSKDLNAINNRLNGTLKRRGALNFDEVDAAGLVTDSVVATTLQNGGSSSSSSPPMANIKSEQPDS